MLGIFWLGDLERVEGAKLAGDAWGSWVVWVTSVDVVAGGAGGAGVVLRNFEGWGSGRSGVLLWRRGWRYFPIEFWYIS